MIYVTGDTHGRRDFVKLLYFAEANPGLTKRDYVIIAGDFGGVWSEQTLEFSLDLFSGLPFTVLFVDGNHENFDLLDAYPVQMWKGGKVHFIRPDIIHLMRGQVYTLEYRTIFTFGGGTSVDKAWRVEGESWWAREIPSEQELEEGIANLRRFGNRVDFIITHSCDERALWDARLRLTSHKTGIYEDNLMLSWFEQNVSYKHWYFGHYHVDLQLSDIKTAIYRSILPLV